MARRLPEAVSAVFDNAGVSPFSAEDSRASKGRRRMNYKEFGNTDKPPMLLLHGEFLSWWAFQDIIDSLKGSYHVIVPVISGHGESGEDTFGGIQNAAQEMLQLADCLCHGSVHLLYGVSLGAQIALEMMARRPGIAEYALLQSASVIPRRKTIFLPIASSKPAYMLFRQKYFARLRARDLNVPAALFPRFYRDSLEISYASWKEIKESVAGYMLPEALCRSSASIFLLIGSKEIASVDKSVRLLMNTAADCRALIVPDMERGELRFTHFSEYLAIISRYEK